MENLLARTPEPFRAGFERMNAVREEHNQLSYFEGRWTNNITVEIGPELAPLEGGGTTVAEPIHGGRHYLLRDEGTFGDTPYTSTSTIGFDNVRGEFVTTTTDSLRTGVFVAYGQFNPDENAYTFYGEVPNMRTGGGANRVRLVRRIIDNDHFAFEWYEMRDGKEVKTMESVFTRQ